MSVRMMMAVAFNLMKECNERIDILKDYRLG
jgi:hypothetical protein